jgi:hypothetical protein
MGSECGRRRRGESFRQIGSCNGSDGWYKWMRQDKMRIPFHFVSSKARFGVALLQHGIGQDRNADKKPDQMRVQACSLDHTITDRTLFCFGTCTK